MEKYIRTIRTIGFILISGFTFLFVNKSFAQATDNLTIGDPAPSLKYSKWIKGNPIKGFEDGKVYVLEFWATWCVPCIKAMPHLSELAKKYKSTTTFIGVNVSEYSPGGRKTYEEVLVGVERFVNGIGDRMSYNVIADNKAGDMDKSFLKAAGIEAIPSTIVIKDNRIFWIGDPMDLDMFMTPIINGSFDVTAFKKQYETKANVKDDNIDEVTAAINELKMAIIAKDYTKALELIDADIKSMPFLKQALTLEKFKIYLEQYRESEAIICAKEMVKEDNSYGYKIAGIICDKDSLSKSTDLFAADIYKNGLKNKKSSLIYDKLALAYSKAGDMPAAVKAEEKAVEQAKIDVKDPAMVGFVFEYTITDFQEKLKKYRSAVE